MSLADERSRSKGIKKEALLEPIGPKFTHSLGLRSSNSLGKHEEIIKHMKKESRKTLIETF